MARRRVLIGYLIALTSTLVAGGVRLGLSSVFQGTAPLIPFMIPVTLAGWFGGWKPGLLATALGAAWGAWFFLPSFSVLPVAVVARLLLYVVASVTITLLCEQLHRARRRLEADSATLAAEIHSRIEVVRAKDAELQLVANATPVLLTRCSRDMRYVFVNRACAEKLGRSAEDFVGRRIDEMLGDEAFEKIRPHIDRVLQGEPVAYEMEIPYRDLGTRTMSIAYTPEKNADGVVAGWIASVIDVTEQRKAERELARSKDAFLATLAHELRNPVAAIRSAVEILKVSKPNAVLLEQNRDVMDRQLSHLTRLLDDLLDVNRIGREKLTLRKEWVTLSSVIDAAVETTRTFVEGSCHALTVTLPPAEIRLHADPVRLAQLFSNLLTNAAKYTERGGRIELTATTTDDELTIRVVDNGIGITPDELPRVFEMFWQMSSALERSQSGLGVGLALAKALAELHGGRLTARSDGRGKGSEFTVQLPIDSAAQSDGEIRAPVKAAPPMARRLLVADDVKDNADTLVMLLELLGHEVEAVYDGVEAVARAETFHPEVVLLDIGMPRLNGYDACRRIRQQQWGSKMSIVALSGWGQDADRRAAFEAGFDEHLLKPVDAAVLTALLARL